MQGSQSGWGKSEEVIIKPECLLWAAALALRDREWVSTSIRLSRSMPRAWSREHSRMREDHTKEGASLVGGHQKKCFSLSRFQERAHFSLFPLTPFLMLYSSACPPWTSVYCCLRQRSEESLVGFSDQIKYGIQYTFWVWQCFIFHSFSDCGSLTVRKMLIKKEFFIWP